jgi:hypothetical protein
MRDKVHECGPGGGGGGWGGEGWGSIYHRTTKAAFPRALKTFNGWVGQISPSVYRILCDTPTDALYVQTAFTAAFGSSLVTCVTCAS